MMKSKKLLLTVILTSLMITPAVYARGGNGNQPAQQEEGRRAVQRQQPQQPQPQPQEEPRQAVAPAQTPVQAQPAYDPLARFMYKVNRAITKDRTPEEVDANIQRELAKTNDFLNGLLAKK